jgi:hypothetical protein
MTTEAIARNFSIFAQEPGTHIEGLKKKGHSMNSLLPAETHHGGFQIKKSLLDLLLLATRSTISINS